MSAETADDRLMSTVRTSTFKHNHRQLSCDALRKPFVRRKELPEHDNEVSAQRLAPPADGSVSAQSFAEVGLQST